MNKRKYTRLALWLAFGVVFALAPLFCNFLMLRVDGKTSTIMNLCSRGELFLISAVIAAEALGKLFTGTGGGVLRLACGTGCVYLLFWSSVEFAMLAPRLDMGQTYNSVGVATDSIWLFIFSVAAGAGATLMLEE